MLRGAEGHLMRDKEYRSRSWIRRFASSAAAAGVSIQFFFLATSTQTFAEPATAQWPALKSEIDWKTSSVRPSGIISVNGNTFAYFRGVEIATGALVVGLEHDALFGGSAINQYCAYCGSGTSELRSAKIRVGLSVDKFTPYATIGFAAPKHGGSAAGFESAGQTWSIGGGIEYSLSDHLSLRADFSREFPQNAAAIPNDTVLIGVTFKSAGWTWPWSWPRPKPQQDFDDQPGPR
jgi:opacity protein-like surface antigen